MVSKDNVTNTWSDQELAHGKFPDARLHKRLHTVLAQIGPEGPSARKRTLVHHAGIGDSVAGGDESKMQHPAEIGTLRLDGGRQASIRCANPSRLDGRKTHAGSQGSIDWPFA
jgi:hypothetical protein